MYEIEIKSYCNNSALVEEQLRDEKAHFVGELYQHDLYFNHPSRDFKNSDEALRIRSVNGIHYVTYKGPKVSKQTKTRIEHETIVGDFDTFRSILQMTGFVESGEVVKTRREYTIDDLHICLDNVEGAGTFVEFEINSNDIALGEQRLFEAAEHYGLRRFERRSYLSLILNDE
ncbi:MAG: class IV adenylate cyclase [Spirochaetes bacterium]|jgi:adenylate cyclase class 2|nr:class IV adenylate cyclase [Spirochaetota bacterium]